MIVAYGSAILLGAALLFILEPMFARMVLPLLGGSPAVWNTALVFYQLALLAGYAYVHWSTARWGVRRQVWIHLGLIALAVVSLPIQVAHGWQPRPGENPIPGLLGVLALSLGLPFLAVSTTGPLLQKWFAATRHRWASDPYFLYAASNLGSMVGLLGYPLWLEPRLKLAEQTRWWAWGYALLAALIVVCAVLTRRAASRPAAAGAPDPAVAAPVALRTEPPAARQRWRWVLLAFVPSSLMMGATSHITTDVAAVPLLWVLPLAIYLLSFILVFARRPLLPQNFWVRALPLMVLPLLIVMVGKPAHPIQLIIGLHLLVLLAGSMVCHGELAASRPSTEHLTEFYLWLAVGGALGGIFNAIVAPLVFESVAEYPLAIVLACMLAPARGGSPGTARTRLLDVLLPLSVAAASLLVVLLWKAGGSEPTRMVIVLTAAVLTFPIYSFSRRPVRFGLGVAALLVANPVEVAQGSKTLYAERSFFGIHRVLEDRDRGLHRLFHGTTLHGVQRVRPRACNEPLGYYGPNGALGEVFESVGAVRPIGSVAVAGLGSGGIAAYARPGQRWTFFEIDPVVERIASDPRLFCYLQNPAEVKVVLGDARLSLGASRERFDLIVLDAYSSDAIPVHLLTREALQLYRSRLADRGVMVFHISNLYFRLDPVVARLAADAGLRCWVRASKPVSPQQLDQGLLPSLYAVVASDSTDVGRLAADPEWKEIHPGPAAVLWTDDYSSLFSVLITR